MNDKNVDYNPRSLDPDALSDEDSNETTDEQPEEDSTVTNDEQTDEGSNTQASGE